MARRLQELGERVGLGLYVGGEVADRPAADSDTETRAAWRASLNADRDARRALRRIEDSCMAFDGAAGQAIKDGWLIAADSYTAERSKQPAVPRLSQVAMAALLEAGGVAGSHDNSPLPQEIEEDLWRQLAAASFTGLVTWPWISRGMAAHVGLALRWGQPERINPMARSQPGALAVAERRLIAAVGRNVEPALWTHAFSGTSAEVAALSQAVDAEWDSRNTLIVLTNSLGHDSQQQHTMQAFTQRLEQGSLRF